MNKKTLLDLAKTHSTPLFVIDHEELRKNYTLFRKHFPRVQAYYAVKVNSDPSVVETFYKIPVHNMQLGSMSDDSDHTQAGQSLVDYGGTVEWVVTN